MKTYLIPCLKITLLTLVLFGILYPLAITGIANLTAANHGEGKTVSVNGKVVGFDVIGQAFVSDRYFTNRPSAVSYNAAATGGSNKGPSNPEYLKQVEERIAAVLSQNPGVKKEDIPVDLVTASGGGLDPHISPQAALIQVSRISQVRKLDQEKILTLIHNYTEKPLWGLFGPKKINVLALNIAMDKL